ncbi:type I-E CRISPR-associated protein Cas5/CasD [Candidatus Methanomassiliicoccus intestinalis]|uniref:type I-E CRISPR-associated protein Cas5/CasD n=1 Tax=Candidatus Methanomassiliicoccus intestinalis TaxID=1406512 RepID=UPI0037DC950C
MENSNSSATLLLRLAGPLQSWGSSSKFNTRNADRYPSKSAVIGMIAAAMGRCREEPLDDLSNLKFGVRIDQEGELLIDYHTVHHPTKSKLAFITHRHYLSDAVFLVGLEGDKNLLEEIDQAIKHPFFPLYLGRRSCPPSGQISLGICDAPLEESLKTKSWLASNWYKAQKPQNICLEIISELPLGNNIGFSKDMPVSFDQNHRIYNFRQLYSDLDGVALQNKDSRYVRKDVPTNHDPIQELKRTQV